MFKKNNYPLETEVTEVTSPWRDKATPPFQSPFQYEKRKKLMQQQHNFLE